VDKKINSLLEAVFLISSDHDLTDLWGFSW